MLAAEPAPLGEPRTWPSTRLGKTNIRRIKIKELFKSICWANIEGAHTHLFLTLLKVVIMKYVNKYCNIVGKFGIIILC